MRPKVREITDSSNTAILGSNPAQDIEAFPFCVGRGLAMTLSLIQGALRGNFRINSESEQAGGSDV